MHFVKEKKIHFIGIKGAGMISLSQFMQTCMEADVSGSDISGDICKELKKVKIKVWTQHDAENVLNADIVVISPAICKNNVEYQFAKRNKIPIYTRSQMLAMVSRNYRVIAVSGSHGKTTTVALIGHILDQAGFDPTIINGGKMKQYDNNFKKGGDILIVEADESDGGFLKLSPDYAVLLNVDDDHVDQYKSKNHLKNSFKDFCNLAKEKIIIGADCLNSNAGIDIDKLKFLPIVCGDFQNGYRAIIKDLQMGFSSIDIYYNNDYIDNFICTLPLSFNIKNILIAIAVCKELGVKNSKMKQALRSFKGVSRRFDFLGNYLGASFYHDYAHHPTEISALLKSIKNITEKEKKVICVFEPHRYSRVKNFLNEFIESLKLADLIFALPIFGAFEKKNDIKIDFKEKMKKKLFNKILFVDNVLNLAGKLEIAIRHGDIVLFIGAGKIDKIAKSVVLNFTFDNKVKKKTGKSLHMYGDM